jgi:hypothetical protein
MHNNVSLCILCFFGRLISIERLFYLWIWKWTLIAFVIKCLKWKIKYYFILAYFLMLIWSILFSLVYASNFNHVYIYWNSLNHAHFVYVKCVGVKYLSDTNALFDRREKKEIKIRKQITLIFVFLFISSLFLKHTLILNNFRLSRLKVVTYTTIFNIWDDGDRKRE